MIHRNIENGKNFEINVLEAEQTEKFTLGFAFNIYPLADEFVAIDNAEDDEDPLDDGPYHQAESELNAFDIRALFKIVRIDMYRPSFTKRHLINLGSADPSALFWNRQVIFEANKDTGNYHAFLYASVNKNQRYHESKDTKTLLGYSPLLKIDARRGGTNAGVPQGFSEYQVTIPVKLENLFKHKLWNLKMHIYQFDEDDLPAENNHNQSFDDDDTCPICLEPLTPSENRPILKLHGKRSNNSNYEHIYHSDCITTWIVSKETLRCPLCTNEPKLIIVADFTPIFFNSASIYHKMYMNPLGQLFQIANSDEADTFKHSQVLHAFVNIVQKMQKAESAIKKCLSELDVPLLMDKLFGETFFDIGFYGFVEKQILENVRQELETIVEHNFTHKIMQKAKEVLKVIKSIREELESQANAALETIQFISEDE
ncbi:hypothetical protein GPALN_004467 [Globodera pallida]|nr:hypothetical protein GPALN_004467 [Globodera pallida]